MLQEVQRVIYYTNEQTDSQCSCEGRSRAIEAVKTAGYGMIKCTDDSVNDILNNGLDKLQLPECMSVRIFSFSRILKLLY